MTETDIQFGQVPRWLLEAGLSDRATTMYAWLAAIFDIGKEQWAGLDWLAERSHKSKSYVTRALAELEEAGAITRRRRRNQTTLTTIHRLSPQMRLDGEVKSDCSGEVKSDSLSRPSSYPDLEEPRESSSSSPTEFDQFYNSYPLKRGRGEAAKAWPGARRKASFDEIMAGVAAYIVDVKKQRENGFRELKWKQPGPWLNAERWADDYGAAEPLEDPRCKEIEKARRHLEGYEREERRASKTYPYDEESARIMGETVLPGPTAGERTEVNDERHTDEE